MPSVAEPLFDVRFPPGNANESPRPPSHAATKQGRADIFSVINRNKILDVSIGIIANSQPDMKALVLNALGRGFAQDEIFGPVLSVLAYDSEDEAIWIANDSKYGLHASVLGTNLQRVRRVASQIRAGRVVINGMTDDPQAPGEDSNTPALAVNMADTGSRRFSKPAPFLSPKERLS